MSETNPASEIELAVSGMACAACASRVEKVLSRTPGVANASVDLAGKKAMVAGSASAAELIAAVERAGYEAALVGGAAPAK